MKDGIIARATPGCRLRSRPSSPSTRLSSDALTTRRSLLLTIWDENDDSPDQVATLVIGEGVPSGFQSQVPCTHRSLPRPVKTAWGPARLTANDSAAEPRFVVWLRGLAIVSAAGLSATRKANPGGRSCICCGVAASEPTEQGAGVRNRVGERLPRTLIAGVRARGRCVGAVIGEAARLLGMEELAMRRVRTSGQDRDAERDLVGELARSVVRCVAPEELGLFAETEADYFRGPGLVLRARGRDEAVGFGLDLALLTPYVLVVGTAVVHFLAMVVSDAVRDEARDELKPVIAGRVRRLLRRDDPAAAARRETEEHDRAPGVTVEQAREVRQVALRQAMRSGLDDEKAALLADAFVGALLVNG